MTGLKLVLPGSFRDTSLPLLRDDPILVPGSILLLDFAHGAAPLLELPTSGVSSVPNLAHREFASASGATDTGFKASISYSAAGSWGKLERTNKGGIHGIVSQAVGVTNGQGARIIPPVELRNYLFANRTTHDFYVSGWHKITRSPLGGAQYVEYGSGSNAQRFLFVVPNGVSPGQSKISPADGLKTTGPVFWAGNVTPGASNITSAPSNSGAVWGAPFGSYNAAITGDYQKMASHITYRSYIEDLTISGRTWQEVADADLALYTAEVLTPGGRYYNDAYTNPTALP